MNKTGAYTYVFFRCPRCHNPQFVNENRGYKTQTCRKCGKVMEMSKVKVFHRMRLEKNQVTRAVKILQAIKEADKVGAPILFDITEVRERGMTEDGIRTA